jgi:hypothetical protein
VKTFSQFLTEDIKDVADFYVNKYGAKHDVTGHGVALQKVLNDPDYVKGQCHAVAHHFANWASSNFPQHKYKVIQGETKHSTTERPDPHYAVSVNGTHVVDLTSKQFHPKNPVVHISTTKDFKKAYPKKS